MIINNVNLTQNLTFRLSSEKVELRITTRMIKTCLPQRKVNNLRMSYRISLIFYMLFLTTYFNRFNDIKFDHY
jgi:hypothetical protein